MVFSSTIFLFLFLPVFLAGYFLMPGRWRSGWILAGSWFYYGWWRIDFLLLLIGTSLWAWYVGTRIVRQRELGHPGRTTLWRSVGVTVPLAVLFYFKYFNFGIDSLSGLSRVLGGQSIIAWHVILPVGISFYTFQIISYIVDVYRDTVPAGRSLVDVAAYVSLFPQLVAGPIVRYKDIAHQFHDRPHGIPTVIPGARRFMVGLARKVLIADAVAPIVRAVFAESAPPAAAAWLGTLAYAVQIYFDFAAYSDMAIGLGLMLGFRLPENFDVPYLSGSITEFWRRWHMTLSAWLRDYLYIPLGGSRRGSGRTVVNLMTVMVLGGLWHGAAWSFVAWGAWHGLWLIVERVAFGSRARQVHSPWYRVLTLLVILLSWVLFRSESFAGAMSIIAGMFGGHGAGIPATLAWQLSPGAITALVTGIVICIAEPWLRRTFGNAGDTVGVRYSVGSVAAALLFGASVFRVVASAYSPFLYFRF